MMDVWAAVPVKAFTGAKSRTGSVLTPLQREVLAATMLEDVLTRLAGAERLAGIMVNTIDPVAAALAERYGARVVTEGALDGHTGAVNGMGRVLAAEGKGALLTVPGDIPRVTSAEIDAVVSSCRPPPSFTIVPAHDELGSNAVLCAPPFSVPLRFGDDSYFPHLMAARRARDRADDRPAAGHRPGHRSPGRFARVHGCEAADADAHLGPAGALRILGCRYSNSARCKAWPKRRDGFLRVAVFAVHGGVVGGGQQQLVAIRLPVGVEIHQHALGDFLVVRVVAQLAGGQGDPLHQVVAFGDVVAVGLRPTDGFGAVQRADRRIDAVQKLVARSGNRRLTEPAAKRDGLRRCPADDRRRGWRTSPRRTAAAAGADGRTCRRTRRACSDTRSNDAAC